MESNEKILCAAIWYKELKTATYLPIGVTKGVVLCSHRHQAIISNMVALTGLRTVLKGKKSVGEYVQGFITTENRFVDRKEALEIAKRENQLIHDTFGRDILYSEDIY